ncbi:hypothetical protein [Phycicoccus avicenniae]|uniref:hypothetical protein n=1 Tax=Phycicoccus avicenniae TaxID=2828860 RepID=UPI003D2BE6F2
MTTKRWLLVAAAGLAVWVVALLAHAQVVAGVGLAVGVVALLMLAVGRLRAR